MSNDMMHIVNYMMKFLKLNILSIIKCYIYIYIYIKDSTHSKSKASHLSNIWNDKTNYEINDAHCAIHITNTINIEQYDL